MSDTMASLRRKIGSADELQSVVRTMKAMAAASIGQYENAVAALDAYYRTVQLGLTACLRQRTDAPAEPSDPPAGGAIGAVIFGSDQGLVGPFNDVVVDFALQTLAPLPGKKIVWAVGERVHARLTETQLPLGASFVLPGSIDAIALLVGQILAEVEGLRERGEIAQVYLFHHRPAPGAAYAPASQRLLPLDQAWRQDVATRPWPTRYVPEVLPDTPATVLALLREYLFVSLFRACAESLASENASRLAAMQRAEKNIDELLDELNRSFHRLRQSGIDEELSDVVAGFEALG